MLCMLSALNEWIYADSDSSVCVPASEPPVCARFTSDMYRYIRVLEIVSQCPLKLQNLRASDSIA
jgi:hypothetical protein